jgi:hypothetical protein
MAKRRLTRRDFIKTAAAGAPYDRAGRTSDPSWARLRRRGEKNLENSAVGTLCSRVR